MYDWASLAIGFSGWSLTEIKDLSPRERKNWLSVAVGLGRVASKS
jgi:hypothetical protein